MQCWNYLNWRSRTALKMAIAELGAYCRSVKAPLKRLRLNKWRRYKVITGWLLERLNLWHLIKKVTGNKYLKTARMETPTKTVDDGALPTDLNSLTVEQLKTALTERNVQFAGMP